MDDGQRILRHDLKHIAGDSAIPLMYRRHVRQAVAEAYMRGVEYSHRCVRAEIQAGDKKGMIKEGFSWHGVDKALAAFQHHDRGASAHETDEENEIIPPLKRIADDSAIPSAHHMQLSKELARAFWRGLQYSRFNTMADMNANCSAATLRRSYSLDKVKLIIEKFKRGGTRHESR